MHLGVADYKTLPLTQIYAKLQNSREYQKKRELKMMVKSNDRELRGELQGIEE